jgi:hypothetical protein
MTLRSTSDFGEGGYSGTWGDEEIRRIELRSLSPSGVEG